MRHSLRTYILFLENTTESLRNGLTCPGLSIEEVEDIKLQLSTSESALEHYRKANALEAELTVPEPPNHPSGSEPAGEDKRPDKSSSRNNNEGLARFAVTAKRQMSQQGRNLAARSRFRRGIDCASSAFIETEQLPIQTRPALSRLSYTLRSPASTPVSACTC